MSEVCLTDLVLISRRWIWEKLLKLTVIQLIYIYNNLEIF
jgi:hypothetical protein